MTMPRIIKTLLKGKRLISIESIIAEDEIQMLWLSELHSNPNINIEYEHCKNLATHVLFIVKYNYPEEYAEELRKKKEKILHKEVVGNKVYSSRDDRAMRTKRSKEVHAIIPLHAGSGKDIRGN